MLHDCRLPPLTSQSAPGAKNREGRRSSLFDSHLSWLTTCSSGLTSYLPAFVPFLDQDFLAGLHPASRLLVEFG
jgi:hypothetical protein